MKMSIVEVMSPLNILFVRVLSISNLFIVALVSFKVMGEQYTQLIGSEH